MSTTLRVATGNRSKVRLPIAEPVVETTRPDMPEHLTEEARKEWDRIIPVMENMGVLSLDSRPSVASYCQAYSRWIEASADLRERGIILETDKGYRYSNPAVAVENKSMAMMLRFLVEFGLTPSARGGVKSNKPVKAENDLDAFILKKRTG